MTFDEALDELKREAFWSTGFPEIQEIEFEKVKYAVEKLREEYAPTIDMSKSEKDNILSSIKFGLTFIHFYEDVLRQSTAIKFGTQTTPELYKSFSESQLMQAYLRPEMIKVVDN